MLNTFLQEKDVSYSYHKFVYLLLFLYLNTPSQVSYHDVNYNNKLNTK